MPSNQVEHDRVNVAQEGFTSSGYNHEDQSIAGWLTPNDDGLTQWDANLFFFFFSLHCFFRYKKQKNRMLWSEDSNGGRQRDEGYPRSYTNCWDWGRPPVWKRSHNILFLRKNLRIGDMEQNMHRERERQKEVYLYYQECNNEQPTTTFTKGYFI